MFSVKCRDRPSNCGLWSLGSANMPLRSLYRTLVLRDACILLKYTDKTLNVTSRLAIVVKKRSTMYVHPILCEIHVLLSARWRCAGPASTQHQYMRDR